MTTTSASDRAQLLRMARDAITANLRGDHAPTRPAEMGPISASGLFVTLRKHGRLRGCIGTFDAGPDFFESLCSIAVSAAHDPRFTHSPLSATELGDVDIEISLLSPLRRLDHPLDFELGTHGVYVRMGRRAGCFLPDVATERAWSREEFLSECCAQKAGLSPDAWRDPAAELFVFTVEKFGDD